MTLSKTKVKLLVGPQSVDALLEKYDSMTIPHFQRGLVWARGSVELLLESLYHNTPCGSIILWTPTADSIDRSGLRTGAKYLIVDGQQRLHSLHAVFGRPKTEPIDAEISSQHLQDMDRADSEPHDDRRRIWCLNLGAVPELQQSFPSGKRFELFRFVRDPRGQLSPGGKGTVPVATAVPGQEALLPLAWFLERTDAQVLQLVSK